MERFGDEAYFAALCIRSGMVGPELPHRVAQMLLAFERFGMIGGAISAGAIRHGNQLAIIDERGELSYKELDERTNAIANAWRERGLQPGEGVAVLVRNHRGFLEAIFAAAKCGARIILLNTSFAGPQIRDVATREETDLLVYDDEYAEMLEGVEPTRGRYRAWAEEPGEDTLDALAEVGSTQDAAAPRDDPAHHHPDQRDDRYAEGSAALRAALAGAVRGPAQQGPLPRPRGDRDGRAHVPRPRLRPGHGGHRAWLDARRAPAL